MKEEIFGPVLVIREFFDEDEVIAKANETEFGLSGAVFSQDINRALRVSSKIQAGTVCVNCCTMLDATVAFGGYKSSGWGRELGKVSRHQYLESTRTNDMPEGRHRLIFADKNRVHQVSTTLAGSIHIS